MFENDFIVLKYYRCVCLFGKEDLMAEWSGIGVL